MIVCVGGSESQEEKRRTCMEPKDSNLMGMMLCSMLVRNKTGRVGGGGEDIIISQAGRLGNESSEVETNEQYASSPDWSW